MNVVNVSNMKSSSAYEVSLALRKKKEEEKNRLK